MAKCLKKTQGSGHNPGRTKKRSRSRFSPVKNRDRDLLDSGESCETVGCFVEHLITPYLHYREAIMIGRSIDAAIDEAEPKEPGTISLTQLEREGGK